MMESVMKIKVAVELCLIPKLSRDYDECQNHPEFEIRDKRLDENFHILIKKLEALRLKDNINSEYIITYLFILYYELSSNNEKWKREKCLKLSERLDNYFELCYKIKLKNILLENEIFCSQGVFDKCIECLHEKLSSQDFKRYPGQIDVYVRIVENIKKYNVSIVPTKVLPASLHLINDYIIENKISGLKCCLSALLHMEIILCGMYTCFQIKEITKYYLYTFCKFKVISLRITCLILLPYKCVNNKENFAQGNYYDVIYLNLKKVLPEKDIETTKLVIKCLMTLCNILPINIKQVKLDDMYDCVLDQLIVESNLYRKEELINFTRTIITIHKIHCANRNVFYTIIADNLDLCCNEAVSEVLLDNVLKTLKEWITYCWCVWKLPTGQKILSNLFKIMYSCKEDNLATEVQNLIVTLIMLSSEDEKKQISKNLGYFDLKSVNAQFLNRIRAIKGDIKT